MEPKSFPCRELTDLRMAVAFVSEAVLALNRVVAQCPQGVTPEWLAEYQYAWRYFEEAHAHYRDKATALRIREFA
jgi:hypothetical protein